MEQVQSQTVFSGPFVDVAMRRYRRADGSEVERQVIEHPGSVGIVAHDEQFVYLVRQPREAVGEDGLLEIPAGALDVAGESELECAKRELGEEVGLAAEHWSLLHEIYASPGFLDEKLTLFEATDLSSTQAESDAEEQIEIVRLPLTEVGSALAEIRDAKTLVGLLLLLRLAGAAERA